MFALGRAELRSCGRVVATAPLDLVAVTATLVAIMAGDLLRLLLGW